MKIKIISTQPSIYDSFLKTGLIARGIDKKILDFKIYNLHDFAVDTHRSIDDTPYGGGAGMVLRVDIMDRALSELKTKNSKLKTILLTPQGRVFNQKIAQKLAKEKELILIAGRFEGYDERIRDLVDEEISVGDYVLASGDLPAMVLVDAVSRLVPGFIQKSESLKEESFSELKIDNCKIGNCLEYPQYTRPVAYEGKKVPSILLSGNHAKIARWRQKQAILRTKERRADLNYIKI